MVAKKRTPAVAKSHVRNPLKTYFLLMTLVGVIGTLVSFGILTYAIGKQMLITDNEYIIGDRYYEIDACNTNMKDRGGTSENYGAPTKAEIEECKAEKTITLIQGRKVMFKTDVLSGAIWGILFLALLLIHYPRFIAFSKKEG